MTGEEEGFGKGVYVGLRSAEGGEADASRSGGGQRAQYSRNPRRTDDLSMWITPCPPAKWSCHSFPNNCPAIALPASAYSDRRLLIVPLNLFLFYIPPLLCPLILVVHLKTSLLPISAALGHKCYH